MDPIELCRWIGWVSWVVLWGACSLLAVTWRLFLTNRYLREGLAREQQRHIATERAQLNSNFGRHNALQKSLLESFLREPTPTLQDLAGSTDSEYRLTPSDPRSAENDPSGLRTRRLTPR
jgi:hypothetical protein